MGFIHGVNRHEAILFPERLDDYMAEENLVRFIDAFVDHLNLTTLGCQRATPAATGRPAYHPADLLKLYIYSYLYRLRSSRRLGQATHRTGGVDVALKEAATRSQDDCGLPEEQPEASAPGLPGVHGVVQTARPLRG